MKHLVSLIALSVVISTGTACVVNAANAVNAVNAANAPSKITEAPATEVGPTSAPSDGIEKGLPANAKERVSSNSVYIVDVREPLELKTGMVAGAVNMPLSLIEKNSPEYKKFLAGLPKDKEIWLYCRSGRRSGIAAEKLKALNKGYKLRNVGGFGDWQAAGLPTK